MNKQEALQILAIMQAAYPNFYKGTKEEAMGTVSVWCTQFSDMPAEIVLMAIHKLIGTNKFPPTVSEVKSKLVSIGYEAEKILHIKRQGGNLTENEIQKICEQFDIKGELIKDSIRCHGSGNINKTFMATYEMENGEKKNEIYQIFVRNTID